MTNAATPDPEPPLLQLPLDQLPLAQLLDQLERILEEERATLLAGSPGEITDVTQRKLALVEAAERRVTGRAQPAGALDRLRHLARYNRDNFIICSTMLRHMTAALDRLRRRDPHRSYGPDGMEQSRSHAHPIGAA